MNTLHLFLVILLSRVSMQPCYGIALKDIYGEDGSEDEAEPSLHREVREYDPACIRRVTTLTCRTIPTQIPSHVTTVIVTSQDTYIPNNIFQHASFANVSHLFLNGEGLDMFDVTSFVGLENLIELTLSGMRDLQGSSLQCAMSIPSVLPKMKHFALNTGELFQSPILKLENKFLNKLIMNGIDSFNLSNVITAVKFQDLNKLAYSSNLTVMNLTGSFLIVDFSITYDEYTGMLQYNLEKPLMKILDTSRLHTTIIPTSCLRSGVVDENGHANNSLCNITPTILLQFFFVEIWYFRNTLTSLTNYEGYCDLSATTVFLKKLVVSGNYIGMLNITFIFPKNNALHSVDLTNNKMKYIGPGMFRTWTAVEELLLSGNKLYNMEHLPEFEKLTTTMGRLTYLDLANNKLTFLPRNMFQSNRQLKTLILAENRLKSISLDMGPLTNMHELDIRGNSIATHNNAALTKLKLIFQTRHQNLNILFAGNLIQCSCESVNFITWLVSLREVTKEQLVCDYGSNSINVDKAAVRKCKFLCHRILIIAVSTASSIAVVLLVLSAVVGVRRFKTRQKKRNIEFQLREIIEAENFMCFMSILGNDEPLVDRVVLEHLQRLLRGMFGLERDLVCTGYRFKPGFPICEEAYRLMKKCQVFVAVVSESFLRSQYCMLELQEACKQNMPTILIFLGHVDTEDMPQYMQEVFMRTSRAWIKQNDEGQFYVEPKLIDICDAIWDLAIADLSQRT